MPNLCSSEDMNPGYLLGKEFDELVFEKVEETELISLDKSFTIWTATNKESTYFKLENSKQEPLSVIRLKKIKISGYEYFKVDKSHSIVKRKGYGTKLYEYIFCYLDLPVISDEKQTKGGSSDVWKKFRDLQKDSNYKIEIHNKNTGHVGDYNSKNYNDYDIWGMNEQFLDSYKNFPDLIFDESQIGTNNYFEQDLYFEDSDEWVDYYENQPARLPTLSDDLRRFIINGYDKKTQKTRLLNREHILLIGSRKF